MSIGWLIFTLVLLIGGIFGVYFYFKKKNEKVDLIFGFIEGAVNVIDNFLEEIDKNPDEDTPLELSVDVLVFGLKYLSNLKNNPDVYTMSDEELLTFIKEDLKVKTYEFLAEKNIEITEAQKETIKTVLDIVVFFGKLLIMKKITG